MLWINRSVCTGRRKKRQKGEVDLASDIVLYERKEESTLSCVHSRSNDAFEPLRVFLPILYSAVQKHAIGTHAQIRYSPAAL